MQRQHAAAAFKGSTQREHAEVACAGSLESAAKGRQEGGKRLTQKRQRKDCMEWEPGGRRQEGGSKAELGRSLPVRH